MIYKQFHDLQLSSLGLGCMRLPKLSEKDSDIDEAAVEQMVAAGFEPPIFKSSNADGGDAHNEAIFRQYYGYRK